MAQKQRITAALPEYVAQAITLRSKVMDQTKSEYAAQVLEWWFSRGCPPVTATEKFLLEDMEFEPVQQLIKDLKEKARKGGR
jgi:hypothetical protein